MLSEKNYLHFQKRINESIFYRYFWTFWGNYAFVIFILVGIWIYTRPEWPENWQAIVGLSILSFVLTRGVVISVTNKFIKRVCPYQKFNIRPEETKFFSFRNEEHDSFPSGHAGAYFAVASVVFLFQPMLGVILIIASIMAGIGRVIMGWHWPSDIMAGLIIGSVIGYLTVRFALPLFFTLT